MTTTGRIKRETTVADSYKLPELGKIKVGQKKKTQNRQGKEIEIPESLDYFVVGEGSKYKAQFETAYPGKPDTIGITFHSNNWGDVCNERYECRDNAGKLVADGDGESFRKWDGTAKEYKPYKPATPAEKEAMKKWGTWKTVLTLKFIIPKIPSVIGVWVFTTGGKASSIPAIRDTFDKVLQDAGTVAGVPFDLSVKKVKSQKPGDTNLYPVVTLIPNLSYDKLEDIRSFLDVGGSMREAAKLAQGKDVKQLGAAAATETHVEEVTAEEVVEEGKPEPEGKTGEGGQSGLFQ